MSDHTTAIERWRRAFARPSERIPEPVNETVRWGSNLIALAGAFTVAYGLLFLYRTYYTEGFEAGVETLGGVSRSELGSTHPEVLSYVLHLHVNLAATFIALGVGMIALAWFGVRRGRRWAWVTAIVLPAIFLSLSIPVHQTVAFDFDALVHMGPAAVGAPILLVGAAVAYLGLDSEDEPPASAEGANG